MLSFLLACLRSNLSGGGGGGPFTITGVNVSLNQNGTSCANKYKVNASLAYTGSPSGITCAVESNFNEEGWVPVVGSMPPTGFPVTVALDGYYNKFGTAVSVQVRVTDEADALNTATSDAWAATLTLCV